VRVKFPRRRRRTPRPPASFRPRTTPRSFAHRTLLRAKVQIGFRRVRGDYAAGRLAGKERILNQKNGRPSGRPKVAQRALPYDESLLGLAEQSPLKYTIGNLSPFFELRQGGIVSTPQRTPYILGIDLGSSSIGWALVHLSPLGKPDAR